MPHAVGSAMTVVSQDGRRPAPIFQRVARDHYTCVPVPGFEKDPAVTKAIREFDPGAVPIWRVQRWRGPDGEANVVHHGLARYFPVPRYLRAPVNVAMPIGARDAAPNMLDVIFEDDSCLRYKQGGWADYLPYDWSVYAWCRFQYDKNTAEAWLRRSEARRAREEREAASIAEEFEYRKRQIEPFLLKKAEEITESDWKQYLEAVWGRDRASRVELRPKKPFVDLGSRSPRLKETHLRVAPAKGVE